VGNDDSGPEDVEDDRDLECETPFELKISAYGVRAHLNAIVTGIKKFTHD
jgi:hypothetical protein